MWTAAELTMAKNYAICSSCKFWNDCDGICAYERMEGYTDEMLYKEYLNALDMLSRDGHAESSAEDAYCPLNEGEFDELH